VSEQEQPKNALERPAGSHSLAAAAQRERWANERDGAEPRFNDGLAA